mgnify:FL=1
MVASRYRVCWQNSENTRDLREKHLLSFLSHFDVVPFSALTNRPNWVCGRDLVSLCLNCCSRKAPQAVCLLCRYRRSYANESYLGRGCDVCCGRQWPAAVCRFGGRNYDLQSKLLTETIPGTCGMHQFRVFSTALGYRVYD